MTAPAPLFTAHHFREERATDWATLEELLDRVEKKSPRKLSEEELIALPRLYRATLSALSVARETSLDAAMIAYLESLSTRAYFILYGCRDSWPLQMADFFRSGWPQAVRALLPEILVTSLLLIASIFAGYQLVSHDPSWFHAIISEELAAGRDMQASTEALRESLYDAPQKGGLEIFATALFTHNSQIAILAFALGFALGIPTLLLVAQNGAMAGALFAVYVPHGLGIGLLGWLSIHGTTEFGAIILAAAAGLHIGRAVAFPGEQSRMAAAALAGRRAAVVMIGVILMLLIAGLLEGFGRQLIRQDDARLAIAGVMVLLWIGYFSLAGRRHG
ncbi:stage II sporulation protein M [Stakelama pacifica]|uniref:Putative membrane protein SpoIIM required for sporulation n=1 Tax=Stakelama pacifica TaxID=517720 RepID=A0A4R6FF96_9SPHN|nr:stage II sporulation protein M [Stakelama pacifica]TDN79064.1 putative membrane protein SpoIIM required for sporulation [Stakelama pacifica]GGO98704.1 membrane protein [Stakelama pacifica]